MIHFMLASIALILWIPQQIRDKIIKDIDKDTNKITLACGYLTITPFLGILSFAGFAYFLFWVVIPDFGLIVGEYLRVFLIELSMFSG